MVFSRYICFVDEKRITELLFVLGKNTHTHTHTHNSRGLSDLQGTFPVRTEEFIILFAGT